MKKFLLVLGVCCCLPGYAQVRMYHGVKLLEYEGDYSTGAFRMVLRNKEAISDTILIRFGESRLVITGPKGGTYDVTGNWVDAVTDKILQYDAHDLQGHDYLIYWKAPRVFEDGERYYELDILKGRRAQEFRCKLIPLDK